MSISTFQDKFVKGGCGKALIIFFAAGMVFSLGFSNCSKGQKLMSTDLQGNKEKTFVTYGDVELPLEMVDKAIQEQSSQLPPDLINSLPPEYKLQMISGGITKAIQAAQIYELAKKEGFKNDDDSVKKAFHISSEADFRAFATDVLRKAGQLKANSTDKELDELIKTQAQGKTLSQLYTEQVTGVDKDLKDGQKQLDVKLRASQQYLKEKLEAGINPTEDDVKKSFEKYNIKRIVVKTDAKVTADQAKAKADKAYADLKAGKSFEDVMDAYSEDTPMPGKKKKSENVIPLDQSSIDQMPDYKIVTTLQPGGYTEPQKVTEGYSIYKFVDKKVELPKEYDKNKDNYKQGYIGQQLQKKFKDSLDALEKDIKPNFQIKAFEAVYRYAKAMGTPPGPDQEKEFKSIYDLAKGIQSSDDKADIGALVEVAAIQHLYDLPTSDKTKLKADRIASLEKYLGFYDNWTYRKEVIDSLKEVKNGDKAFDQLMIAMDKNLKYDAQGQSTFSDISAKFLELKNAGLVKADQEKQFRSKQEQWNIDKGKFDKQQAELKKQQDEDAKKAAAEAKKQADEAKKNGSKKPADNSSSLAPKK